MENETTSLILHRDFTVGTTDERLFGSFLEHMGSTIYGGVFQPDHPSADEHGVRRDVINLLQDLNLSVIRYPGGNFVSGYEWEDGVGPVENRPSRMDVAWQAVEPNTFGLNEFMEWIGEIGAEPLYTVNLGTRGIAEAHNLLEYCNAETDTKFSELRRTHGRKDPYGIRMWCLGNEMDGPWQIASKTASEYGRLAMETGKLMKWTDSSVELVASGSSLPRMASFPEWDRQVLMECYEVVDYISLHHYVDRYVPSDEITSRSFFEKTEKGVNLETPDYLARTLNVDRQIETIIAACDYVKAVKRSSKDVHLCFDEYNVLSTLKDKRENYVPWTVGCPIDFVSHTMEDLLAFASVMLAILRRADRVKIACQSLLVNTGGLVLAPPDGEAFRNSIYFPFMHISRFGRGTVLRSCCSGPVYQTEEFDSVPCIDTAAVVSEDFDTLTVFAVNRTDSSAELDISASDFGRLTVGEHIEVSSRNLRDINTSSAPDVIQPRTVTATRPSETGFVSTLNPYSWNVIRLDIGKTQ